jgi:outer membrane beta-barrel protein
MRLLLCAVVVLASLAAHAASGSYDDEDSGGNAVVIQEREFKMAHEFTMQSGTLPLDAFEKGIAVTGRYTLHFDDFNAWEIIGVTYNINIDSGLQQILQNDPFHAVPQSLPKLLLVADSNYVATPFYGKFALFNSTIIYQELSLYGGLSLTYWDDGSFEPGPDFGAAIKFFLFDFLSLRFDIRHALVMNGVPIVDPNAQVNGVLQLLAGVSFNIGGS